MRVEIISFLRIFDDPLERSRDFSLVGVGLAGFLSGASTARSNFPRSLTFSSAKRSRRVASSALTCTCPWSLKPRWRPRFGLEQVEFALALVGSKLLTAFGTPELPALQHRYVVDLAET